MRFFTRLLAAAVLTGSLAVATSAPLLALDAPASEPSASTQSAPQDAPAQEGRDVVVPLVWALVGSGLFLGALGVLYLLKREMGGFIRKPGAWSAPISVMPAGELPVEEADFPEPEGDSHGH